MLTLVKERPIAEIANLTKRFGEVTALDNITVEIPRGSITGLLGENGSGKTTLLKILAGLYMEYDGSVTIEGDKPSHITKAKVSYLPDKVRFTKEKAPEEVIEFYRTYFDDFNEEKCRSLLEKFELSPDKPFQEMSKGMLEKVQLSLVMARDAKLYLLDEPIGGVDSGAREVVIDAVLDNFDRDSSIIIVTHLINEMERLFDRVMVLKEGRLVGNEHCDELVTRHSKSLEEIVREMR